VHSLSFFDGAAKSQKTPDSKGVTVMFFIFHLCSTRGMPGCCCSAARTYLRSMLPLRAGLITAALCLLPIIASAAEPALTASVTPERVGQGDIAILSLSPTDTIASATCTWNSQTLPLHPVHGRLSTFIPVPMDEPPGPKRVELEITSRDGDSFQRTASFIIEPTDFPVQRLTLPESQVTLSSEDLARHERERAAVAAAYAGRRQKRLWNEGFLRPVSGSVSTPFGVRRMLNDKPRNPHSGVDFRGPLGQPVAAAADGVVVLTADHFFSGKSIYIDHGMGIITMYFHLSEILVETGNTVTRETVIGRIGSTGRSTGPHLHWGVRIHDLNVNPLAFLALFDR
jgi:hypothetical protein